MPQKLRNKKYGEYEVGDISWSNGLYHITLLPNGAYAHIGGNPIESMEDFKRAGMKGEDLEKACNWFRNRHKVEEVKIREVMLTPEGIPVFVDDRSFVDSPSDLINYYGAGKAFDTAMYGLTKRKTTEQNEAKMAAAKEARTGKKTPPRKAAPKQQPKPAVPEAEVAPPVG